MSVPLLQSYCSACQTTSFSCHTSSSYCLTLHTKLGNATERHSLKSPGGYLTYEPAPCTPIAMLSCTGLVLEPLLRSLTRLLLCPYIAKQLLPQARHVTPYSTSKLLLLQLRLLPFRTTSPALLLSNVLVLLLPHLPLKLYGPARPPLL